MSERFGSGLSRVEALRRLGERAQRWPLFGYRMSMRQGFAATIGEAGFVVRRLPTANAAPMIEAIARWRDDGGSDVVFRPALVAYLPSIVINAVVLTGVFLLLLRAVDARLWRVGGSLVLEVALYSLVVIAGLQLAMSAWFLWRRGSADRDALRSFLREALGS